MGYNAKNYTEQGGEKTVIGGELLVTGTMTLTDATIEGVVTAAVVDTLVSTSATDALSAKQGKALKDAADAKVAANQAASVEATTPTVTEFNALLVKLKAAGLMAADE